MRIAFSARSLVVLLACFVAWLPAAPALAQAISDPAWVEFTPSPDHNNTASDGSPLVSRYELDFYLVGAAAPFTSRNLEKPAPASDGLIHIALSSIGGGLPAGAVYESRVRAVGPGGETPSAASNTFTFSTSPCSYGLTLDQSSFDPAGGTTRVSVATASGCNWVASVNVPWIVLGAPSAGQGSGAVNITVSANQDSGNRTGTISIQGQTVTITQAGTSPCWFNITTASTAFPSTGGAGLLTVDSPTPCNWTVATDANWITLGRTTGAAHADVAFNVAANADTRPRTGRIFVGGKTVDITQEASGSSCSFGVSPTSQSFGASGGTGSASVSTSSSCNWNASTTASWIVLASRMSGSGAGALDYTVAPNTGTSSRSGTIAVGSATLTVTQAGTTSDSNCWYNLTIASTSFTSGGGSGRLTVDSPTLCQWTAATDASWITLGKTSGTAHDDVPFTVAANSGATRTGRLFAGGKSVEITQQGGGSGCSFSLNPTAQTIDASGGSGSSSLATASSCSWTAASDAAWLTLRSASSGTGPATISYNVAAHTGSSPRTGNLRVGGTSLVITQSAASTSCTITVAPKAIGVGAGRAQTSVAVSAGPNCGWSAQSHVGWATVVSGSNGTGNGVVTIRVSRNQSNQSRSGTLTVGGQTVNITQSGSTGGGIKSPAGFRVLETR